MAATRCIGMHHDVRRHVKHAESVHLFWSTYTCRSCSAQHKGECRISCRTFDFPILSFMPGAERLTVILVNIYRLKTTCTYYAGATPNLANRTGGSQVLNISSNSDRVSAEISSVYDLFVELSPPGCASIVFVWKTKSFCTAASVAASTTSGGRCSPTEAKNS